MQFIILPSPSIHFRFDASRRLHGSRAFDAVFAARARRRMGPITVCGKFNGLPHCRLGLSVSRKVGNAVTRNRLKRLIREAFRLSQHDLLPGYDLVVVVHPHAPLMLTEYQQLLASAVTALDRHWKKNGRNQGNEGTSDPGKKMPGPGASGSTD